MAQRLLVILVVVGFAFLGVQVSAQDAVEGSVTVSDQLVLNGMLIAESATVPEAGWLVIHASVDGQLGPTVGIAALAAGENQNVQVFLDTLGATPELFTMLHTDTGTPGMYEYDMMPDVDPPVMQGDMPMMTPFNITALTVFPQQLTNNQVIVGSVISPADTWVVIHADENEQPGAALGSVQLPAGTHPAVVVPLTGEATTETLWASLNTSADGTAETIAMVNEAAAMAPIETHAEPVVMTALGAALESDQLPALEVTDQNAMGDGITGTLAVDRVVAPVMGWVEVHADTMGHPGKPLGMTNVPQGETTGVNVVMNAAMVPMVPPTTLPPAVWPMLHVDDNTTGTYEYLMVPGADVPVVFNGTVVTHMVTIGTGDAAATAEAGGMATEEATAEAGGMATEEATAEGDMGMATEETTAEGGTGGMATEEATAVGGTGGMATEQAPVEGGAGDIATEEVTSEGNIGGEGAATEDAAG